MNWVPKEGLRKAYVSWLRVATSQPVDLRQSRQRAGTAVLTCSTRVSFYRRLVAPTRTSQGDVRVARAAQEATDVPSLDGPIRLAVKVSACPASVIPCVRATVAGRLLSPVLLAKGAATGDLTVAVIDCAV